MTLDLSEVTDRLIGLVKDQWGPAPIWAGLGGTPRFTPAFTGLAPDAVVAESGGPQLSMYLYHVEPDNATETLWWRPQPAGATGQPTRFLPLALNLFYLLFAHSEKSHDEEQEAMSVALRIFHANPVVRSAASAAAPWELTLTMEHRSYDELSRLWQATTAPIRMSVVYRAAVVFIDPDETAGDGPPTKAFNVAVGPAPLPLAPSGAGALPVLLCTFRDGTYQPPGGAPVQFSHAPAVVAAGQTAWLIGGPQLGTPGQSDRVFLVSPGGAETDVTAWVAAAGSSAAKFVLTLPATAGAAPAGTPAPGRYQFRVGSGAPGSPGAIRSAPVEADIAAYVAPAGGPLLAGTAPFTVTGTGFTPDATQVLAGTAGLTRVAASPAAGQFTVDAAGGSLTFVPPTGPAGAVVPVRVLVNGVESDPALWVTL
jgi:Pvc16 N-terminal domain